jgi:translation initiation factor 1A
MAEKKGDAGPEEYVWVRFPKEKDNEQFAIVLQLMGGDQIKAKCADGLERNCRIPGKMKKKVWLREGDLIIIKIWDFQPIKADVVWRFLGNQTEWLRRKGYLKNLAV